MRLRLERILSDDAATIGVLYREGLFECFTLEDIGRTKKVWGETRIPEGTYTILLRNKGNMTKRYASKYPDLHEGMLWLQDVDNFEFIYIHIGNTEDDTAGCILVGDIADTRDGMLNVQRSAAAYEKLYRAVKEQAKAGTLTIEIIDRDN